MIDMIGGPGRDRTDDLFHAMEARSQTAPQAHLLRMQPHHFLCLWLGSSIVGAESAPSALVVAHSEGMSL